LRLGWFSTGRGEGSYGLLSAVLAAMDGGYLDGGIEFVFCNRDRGEGAGSDRFMELVESRGIPLVKLSSKQFRKDNGGRPWSELREEFDRAAIESLTPYSPELSVNAGYMLIAPLLCRVHTMINLHPALPTGPVGMWRTVIWDLIGMQARETGAMVHVVTEDVDGGPVLSYCRFPIHGPGFDALWEEARGRRIPELVESPGEQLPLFQAIRQAGLLRERPLLVETLRTISEGRIGVAGAGGRQPVDLTDVVEERVRAGNGQ